MTRPDKWDPHHIKAVENFDWPCDKRIAHGPHQEENGIIAVCDGVQTVLMNNCPGVLAHPAVMIGRIVKP